MKASIRKLDSTGAKKLGLRWCLTWQSFTMAAPSFWYYARKVDAVRDMRELLR